MSEPTDHELLADYARTGSEAAFARLVARYINLVHSAAQRYAGNEAQAGEITQAVFLILARKAGSLSKNVALAGWLYQTARLTAANALKAEARRQLRDHQAYMESQENQADAAVWREIAPLLDDAMGKLGETDRTVLVLRFFEGRTNAETAAALGLAEGAVQKRVQRALEKLRAAFAKQGVTHTAQAIAGTVTTNAVMLAPTALVAKVSLIAAKGAAVSASTLALVKGVTNLMSWSKAKTICVFGSLIVIFTGVTVLTVDEHLQSFFTPKPYKKLFQELRVAPQLVMLQDTHFPNPIPNGFGSSSLWGKFIGHHQTIDSVIRAAYMEKPFNELRAIFPLDIPTNRYDYMITVTNHPRERFQEIIRRKLGYTAHFETITTNCYVLKLAPDGPKLKPSTFKTKSSRIGRKYLANQPIERFCLSIENSFCLSHPILDQTGLSGSYDIMVDWNWEPKGKEVRLGDPLIQENFKRYCKAIKEQLGLELIPTNAPIQMLVVEKVK